MNPVTTRHKILCTVALDFEYSSENHYFDSITLSLYDYDRYNR